MDTSAWLCWPANPARSEEVTPAIRYLERHGIPHQELTYEVDAGHAVGVAAAAALGLPEQDVFKTLIVQLDTGALVTTILPVASSLDLKRLSRAAGVRRAKMASPPMAERATGYVTGGISPLGQKNTLPTYLATEALALERLYISGGKRGLEIAVAPADLISCCQARVVELCRRSG